MADRAEPDEPREGGERRCPRERDDEGEHRPQRTAEDVGGPARGVEDRDEQVGEVVHLHDEERGGDDEDPERVEDERGAPEEERRRDHVGGRRPAPEPVERDREHPEAAEDVHDPPRLELLGRDEELRVGRLQEDEVERPLADVLDDARERRVHRALEHPLHHHEPADDDERLLEAPPCDPRALPEHDEERDEPPPRPEQGEPPLHEEVEPVLHRDRRGRAELDREEPEVAEHRVQPPYAEKRRSPARQTRRAPTASTPTKTHWTASSCSAPVRWVSPITISTGNASM